MSIIAVSGFPIKFTLMDAVKAVAKITRSPVEALNFKSTKGMVHKPKLKTCYFRLSERLDPVRVVEQINDFKYTTKRKLKAYIPDSVPDIPLAAKPKRVPLKLKMALHIPDDDSYEQVLQFTTDEIITELYAKYPGINILNKKTGNKLLQELSKKIFNRVQNIAKGSSQVSETCFKLSNAYRRVHPHFGDFQLVLSTLHSVQDATGTPRTQLQESDLASTPAVPAALDLPAEKLKKMSHTYSDKIINKMKEHINSLDSDISPNDSEDDIARKQVRTQLKKLSPFMNYIVNQIVSKHFTPNEGPFYRIRIYGEPFLPNRDVMGPFLSRFKPVHVMRSTRMFNLLKFNVAPAHFPVLVAMNGTVLNGAKLMIRASDAIGKADKIDYGNDEQMEEDDEGEEEQWDEDM